MSARLRSLLVFNAKFVTGQGLEAISAKRLRRWYLQAVARELLPKHRVSQCLRRWIPGAKCLEVRYSEKHKRAHYGNLVQCAGVWVCPLCSSKITERRRVELEEALVKSTWRGIMITFTFQHNRVDKLAELQKDFAAGRRCLRMGGWWKRFSKRWGIIGTITATEVTYGLAAGWHLHTHELYLVENLPETQELKKELSDRFRGIMQNLGRYVSSEIGVHVRATDRAAADYISKWGAANELTKSIVKAGQGEHYNPFELLYLYGAEGSKWAGDAFIEFAEAMKGVNQIRWSPGLRNRLGLGAVVSDQELVERPEEFDIVMARLRYDQWKIIFQNDKRGELLEVASSGDVELLRSWLCGLGIVIDD
jgi:hypothetical protein